MSAAEVVATLFVLAICVGGTVIIPRAWKGWFGQGEIVYHGRERTHGEIAFFWWPYGEESRRGVVRGIVAAICAGWALLISGLAAELTRDVSGGAAEVLHVIAIVFIVLFAAGLVMNCSVIFLNRPKFIVPPPQRGEPGLLAARAARNRQER